MNTNVFHSSASHALHVDISSPACDLFASTLDLQEAAPVVMLNTAVSPLCLLGFVHGRCLELRMMAHLSTRSEADEDDLREAASLMWDGLDVVIAGLNALAKRMPDERQGGKT